jgi:hypothetical protein
MHSHKHRYSRIHHPLASPQPSAHSDGRANRGLQLKDHELDVKGLGRREDTTVEQIGLNMVIPVKSLLSMFDAMEDRSPILGHMCSREFLTSPSSAAPTTS